MTKITLSFRLSFILTGLIVLISAAGCRSTRLDTAKYAVALANTNPPEPALVKLTTDTPVIDIHTHNFNAYDVPTLGIALGRRDVKPPWSWLITDDFAKFLAASILAATSPDEPRHYGTNREERTVQHLAEFNRTNYTVHKVTNSATYSVIGKALVHKRGVSQPHLTPSEKVILRFLTSILGHKDASLFKSTREVLDAFGPFMQDFIVSDTQLPEAYFKQNGTNIQFRIVHMMDMWPTYAVKNDDEGVPSFQEQIYRMANLQKKKTSHFAYFVAYSPFRDNLHPGDALKYVQDAISSHAAYGVKLYPPAGYRAASNSIPSRPSWLLTKYPGLEWDQRYTRNGTNIPGSELDQRLLNLLTWCASNHIPIFAHSGYGEFQARGGYGQDMPNPKWWGILFTNHPELKELRLCFGHSGGGDAFFGDSGYASWNSEVIDLCRKYPNVYCEVGCLDQVLDTNKQPIFAAQMDLLLRQQPDEQHSYSLSNKIMYGSDWFMPISGGSHVQYLQAYQKIFLLPQLQEFYKRFFLVNALNYLNAEERVGDTNFRIDPVVASELKELLAKAKS